MAEATFDLQFDIVMAEKLSSNLENKLSYLAFTNFIAVFPYKTMVK